MEHQNSDAAKYGVGAHSRAIQGENNGYQELVEQVEPISKILKKYQKWLQIMAGLRFGKAGSTPKSSQAI